MRVYDESGVIKIFATSEYLDDIMACLEEDQFEDSKCAICFVPMVERRRRKGKNLGLSGLIYPSLPLIRKPMTAAFQIVLSCLVNWFLFEYTNFSWFECREELQGEPHGDAWLEAYESPTKDVKPSAYWKFTQVSKINFFYLFVLCLFDGFLRLVTTYRISRNELDYNPTPILGECS